MKPILALETWKVLLLLIPLGVTLLIASITDIKTRKIYNKLTYPMFLVGLVLHTITMGFAGLGDGFLAALLTFVIGLFVMPFGWIKPGDFKLFMVVAAFLGMRGLTEVVFYSVFVGGAIGILHSLFTGKLVKVFKRIWLVIKRAFLRIFYSTENFKVVLDEEENTYTPYAPAIMFATIFVYTDHVYGLPGWMIYYFTKIGYAP